MIFLGPDCYCTLYHGCFHRHFQIKPQIVDGAGLIPGKDKGIHDTLTLTMLY
jgi:hypothetical protein